MQNQNLLFMYIKAYFSPAYKTLPKEQQKTHILHLQLWCLKDTLFFISVYLSSTQQMSQELFTMSVIQMLDVVEGTCERHCVSQYPVSNSIVRLSFQQFFAGIPTTGWGWGVLGVEIR